MRIANVVHHCLRQVSADALADYRSGAPFKMLRLDPVVRDNWISTTAVDWNARDNCLYVGLTAFDNDLLYRFWPETGRFESLGFKGVAEDPRYSKIHRGLTQDDEGGYFFGTAGLIDFDERNDAPGGGIFHYHHGEFEFLGIPIAHDYVQNIEVDTKRQRVYGITYPVMYFFDYDYRNRRTHYSFYTGSHFHESGLDDDGYFWGTWLTNRGNCLFRYHPDMGKPDFYYAPIPNLDPGHLWNFPLNGPIDSFINGKDGYLYFGTLLGDLYQLDPKTGQHRLLGRPSEGLRLSGLSIGPEARLLGSYGADYQTGLFVYDRQTGEFTDLGAVRNDVAACFMVHDIAWDGGSRVFVGETDNVDRSAYLWEVTLG